MVADNLKLDGKLVVITGAGRGLGRAMATKLAGAGADIVAAARTVEQLEETAAEVRKLGRKCLIVPTDVARSEDVNAMAAAAVKEFGKLDVLINNAGAGEDSFGKTIEQISDEDWRRGIDVNLSSQFYGLLQGRGVAVDAIDGADLRRPQHPDQLHRAWHLSPQRTPDGIFQGRQVHSDGPRRTRRRRGPAGGLS
jgi:NAD(P)-dependent dehydrogenase (short-subunit alcohol dehydrogenase family)